MGFFTILIFGLIVVGGNLSYKPENNNIKKEKIEVVTNKIIETKPTIKKIKPEPVKEEIKPEPVKEEIKPEPVKEKSKELNDLKDSETNYLRLVLYIIAGILVVITGMYFFFPLPPTHMYHWLECFPWESTSASG